MRVAVVSGDWDICEQFIQEVARHGSIATIKHERRSDGGCDSLENATDVLCVRSSSRCSMSKISSDYESQVKEELDRIAEHGDVDFAIVLVNEIPLRLTALPEVYYTSFEGSARAFNSDLQQLKDTPEWMTLTTIINVAKSNPHITRAGAILTFTGMVRDDARALLFDVYEGEAQRRIDMIVNDLKRLKGIVDVLIHHKSGRIELGEDIVYIVIAASHRQEGFQALREAIERIKVEVPIWKKELTDAGGHWVGI